MSFLSSSSVFVFCFLSYIQENKKSRIIYIYGIVSGLKKNSELRCKHFDRAL